MTNEELKNLEKIAESENFDDIVLVVGILKHQFTGDIYDKNFIIPKRYRYVLGLLKSRLNIYIYRGGNYNRILQILCDTDIENFRPMFNIIKLYSNLHKI